MTTKWILHKTPHSPPSSQKKTCGLHCTSFQKHPLFTTFLLVFAVDELCRISNKYQPPNNLAKYQNFDTRDFLSLLHFGKKIALSIANVFRNIHFFTTFSSFLTVSEVCNTSSKCWLSNKSANKIFLYKIHYTLPSFPKNNLCSPLQMLLETSNFYHIFTSFSEWMSCYISNKYQPPNNLAKYQYFYTKGFISILHFEKELALSIANVFWNIHFLPHFHYF